MSKAEQKRELLAWAGLAPGQRLNRKEFKALLDAKQANESVPARFQADDWDDESD